MIQRQHRGATSGAKYRTWCVRVCLFVYVHVCIHVYTHVSVCVYMRIYLFSCIHFLIYSMLCGFISGSMYAALGKYFMFADLDPWGGIFCGRTRLLRQLKAKI